MTSLYDRIAAAHRMVMREIRREHRRPAPDPARLARLRQERAAIRARLARHIPPGMRPLRFVRAILARIAERH